MMVRTSALCRVLSPQCAGTFTLSASRATWLRIMHGNTSANECMQFFVNWMARPSVASSDSMAAPRFCGANSMSVPNADLSLVRCFAKFGTPALLPSKNDPIWAQRSSHKLLKYDLNSRISGVSSDSARSYVSSRTSMWVCSSVGMMPSSPLFDCFDCRSTIMSRSCWSLDHSGSFKRMGTMFSAPTTCIICANASRVKLTPRRFSFSICVAVVSDASNTSGSGLFKQNSWSCGGMGRRLP